MVPRPVQLISGQTGLAPPASSVPATMAAEAGGTVFEYLHLLKRHKWFLLLIMAVGAAAGLALSFWQSARFESRATLEIEPRSSAETLRGETERTADTAEIDTHVHVLESRSLRQAAAARLRSAPLDVDTSHMPGPLWELARRAGIPWLSDIAGPSYEAALRSASGSLEARALGQARILEVRCTSPYPTVSAGFANALVAQFIEQDLQSRWRSSEQTNHWLAQELDQLKSKLEQSEYRLRNYAELAGLTFTSDTATTANEDLRHAQSDLANAQADRVSKQARYEVASRSPVSSLADVLNDDSLRGLQTQLTELKRQRAELLATFTPEYYKARNTEAQIATVESDLAAQRTNIMARIKGDFDEAQRRESMFAAVYQGKLREATSDAQKAIRYDMLKREVEANRALYQNVLQRANELDVVSALRASNIRVLDSATAASAPVSPRASSNLVFGLMAGLLFGLAMVYLTDESIHQLNEPGDLSAALSLPELGVIPCAPNSDRVLIEPSSPRSPKILNLETTEPVELVTWNRRPTAVDESFRALLASILYRADGTRPQVIVVTSPNPGEGKSTVASNLSIALAEIQHRVLLIDSDMRHPRLHRVFSVANSWGLIDLLQENSDIETLPLAGICRVTQVPQLWLLPSGPAPISVSHVLFSQRIARLVERCRKEFNTIVVDTAPVLHFADARALGRLSDGVVLVARAAKSRRQSAIAAAEVIARDGTPLLGTVLNDWNPRGRYDLYPAYYRRSPNE